MTKWQKLLETCNDFLGYDEYAKQLVIAVEGNSKHITDMQGHASTYVDLDPIKELALLNSLPTSHIAMFFARPTIMWPEKMWGLITALKRLIHIHMHLTNGINIDIPEVSFDKIIQDIDCFKYVSDVSAELYIALQHILKALGNLSITYERIQNEADITISDACVFVNKEPTLGSIWYIIRIPAKELYDACYGEI